MIKSRGWSKATHIGGSSMDSHRRRGAALLGAALFLVTACGGGATTAPSIAATTAAGPTEVAASPTAAPSSVATIPSDQLVVAGQLNVCSDIPYPPLEYFDDQGNPIGSDMEIAAGLAQRLGLKLVVINTVFNFIMEAVNGGKCDIIISDQNITADRIKAVDMIPYFQAGQAFAVNKGNPAGIAAELDLCGKKVGAETATTEIQYLEGTDLYKTSAGLKKKSTDAGKPAPEAVKFEKDSDAFLALTAKTVDVYFADLPVVAFYVQAQPDQFEQAPITPLSPIKAGISVPKTHTAVLDGVKSALIAMMNDGSYLTILKKYSVDGGALQPSDVVVNQP
jgi:polar amino acid transport system substrate-binding protein